jgi:hypothetical protein
MRVKIAITVFLIILVSCKNAGRELLSGADRSLKEGNYAAALLNVNQFLTQYPSSPDTNTARKIRTEAGTGRRAETAAEIRAKIAAKDVEEARQLAAEIPRTYVYLPDNEHYYADVDSQIKLVEFEILALELERALDEAKVDSLVAKFEKIHERFAADADYLPKLGNLDSVITGALKALPHPPPTVHPKLPAMPVPVPQPK